MEAVDYCPKCGNNHDDDCSAEAVYFYWLPQTYEQVPQEVYIVGDWSNWLKKQKMGKVSPSKGIVFFSLLLAISEGQHQYKFLVDGVWRHDRFSPTTYNPYGSANNIVEILPKKSFKKKMPGQRVKITSNFCMPNLMIMGSWDNWTVQHQMALEYNPLKKSNQNVTYLDLEPNSPYEFIFKHKKQYFIDEKYPTVTNKFGTLNNIIVIYSNQINTSTPRRFQNSPMQVLEHNGDRQFKGKMFSWRKIDSKINLPYERVEGHKMCYVGEYLYIFGGKSRSQFYSTLLRIDSDFDKIYFEEVVPDGRAYHVMKAYGNKILIYGGHNTQVLDDYTFFNVSSGKWTLPRNLPKVTGTKCQKQSCVIYENLLVFFGGCHAHEDTQTQMLSNTLQVLDLENMQWVESIQLKGEYPPPRLAHTAALINADMYIFGGIANLDTGQKLNDFWKLNLMNVSSMRWQKVKPKGTPPQARHGHTMNRLRNLLVIFGGTNQKNEYLSDVCVYNSTYNQWIVPLIQGSVPQGRTNHASANFLENGIVIFGGRTNDKSRNNEFYVFEPADFANKPMKLFDEDDSEDQQD